MMQVERTKIPITSFGNHQYEGLTLQPEQLMENLYPNIRHLDSGFILLPPVSKNALPIASIDCEFCKTEHGLQIVRVIVVNQNLEVVINELVRPKGNITDYLTDIHGIRAVDIQYARSTLEDIQERLIALCDQNTVLVGHDLNCDLKGLKIVHLRCADTKVLFNPNRQKPLNLRRLSELILKKRITKPTDYPRTTMELCLLYESHHRNNLSQRSFGSKQELITRVHTKLLSKFQETGRLVVPLTTCLRGKDTIRIHCKKWDQLMHIEGLLDQIDQARSFEKVCLPISMKTKSQKKGFFVYLKFYSSLDVPSVLEHIRKTGLYKAEVADRVTGSKKTA